MEQLRNNIRFVSVSAPDQFPKEDYLTPEEQTTLEGEFWILYHSLAIACAEQKLQQLRPRLETLLADSFMAYQRGDRKKGLGLLNQFEDIVFGSLE